MFLLPTSVLATLLCFGRTGYNVALATSSSAVNANISVSNVQPNAATLTVTFPDEPQNQTSHETGTKPQPASKLLTAKIRRIWSKADGELNHQLDNEREDDDPTVWTPVNVPNPLTPRQQLDNGGFYASPGETFAEPVYSNQILSSTEPDDRKFPSTNRHQPNQKQRLQPRPPPPPRPRPTKNAASSTINASDREIVAKLKRLKRAGLLQLLLPRPQVDTQCDCPPVACNCGNTTSGGESVSSSMIVCLCNCNGTAIQTSPQNDAVSAQDLCPLDFVPDSIGIRPSTCYFLSTLKASWTDANLECQKMDAKLVEPRTAIDLRKITNLIAAKRGLSAPTTDQQYWIGALQIMFGGSSVPVYKSDMQELSNAVAQQISQKRAAPLNRCLGLVQCSADADGVEQCDKTNGYVLATMGCQQENSFVCQLNPSQK